MPMQKCDSYTHACRSEITLRHGCSLVNLLHSFRTPFLKSTSGGLLLTNEKRILDAVRYL